MGQRRLGKRTWWGRLGIDVRPRRGVRRPTEDEALSRILRDEKRAARAARQQAWTKGQRGKRAGEEEG